MSEKSPYNFSGPESVGKPLTVLGNFLGKLGKKAGEPAKRNQAFADTVSLHRELESVSTAAQGARLQQIAEHHKSMQPIATQSATSMTADGGMQTQAAYRNPSKKPASKPASKPRAAKAPSMETGSETSNAPVKGTPAAATPKTAAVKTTPKTSAAPKAAPKDASVTPAQPRRAAAKAPARKAK
jgi:hypothetical protein